ncbi:MAG: outer membrane beta-barrel protein [Bacteroidia bacterium]|nr:outer membrane beta-barrel protein [Bacteroidia bacterium]
MKKSILAFIIICVCTAAVLKAQDTVRVKVLGKNVVTVVEGGDRTDVKIGNNAIDIKDGHGDTVKVRVGRKALVIADGRHGSDIKFENLDDNEYKSWTGHSARFKGHWAAVEMGINSFANVNYKGFIPNFMDLNQNKSFEISVNFLRYSIGLQKEKRNIGLVTGLGLTYNDYRFSNAYTIENDNGLVKPVSLNMTGLSKSKLSTTYLTVPFMLEFQIPVDGHNKRLYFSGGVIGGLKVGSHTKVKMDGNKSKSRDDFNINPFRYGATTRIGYKGINLFGTYYFSTFFKNGRGPEMFPFTIGIGLMNW